MMSVDLENKDPAKGAIKSGRKLKFIEYTEQDYLKTVTKSQRRKTKSNVTARDKATRFKARHAIHTRSRDSFKKSAEIVPISQEDSPSIASIEEEFARENNKKVALEIVKSWKAKISNAPDAKELLGKY